MRTVSSVAPDIASFIDAEKERIQKTLNLIASENYASPAVLRAYGSIVMNKYAEGYPGKRYYAGCDIVDQIEQSAQAYCKKLFGADHANVQPHAGSQANMAAYFATLDIGDTILGMRLAEGGHLTHGHPINFSGKFYNVVHYGLDPKTEQLDYDAIEQLALQHKPKLIIAGASAYSRTIDFARFAAIAKKVNAVLLADIAHIAGLIAAGTHPSPVGHADIITSTTHKTLRGPRGAFILTTNNYAEKIDKAVMPGTQGGPFMQAIAAKSVAFQEALKPDFITYQQQVVANACTMATELTNLGYRIVSGGTDNHLFIVDLQKKGCTGLQAERALEQAGITVSRSCIPNDPQKPWITSGIRIGTPAITTRGLQKQDALALAHLINDVIIHRDNKTELVRIKQKVETMTDSFPIYSS